MARMHPTRFAALIPLLVLLGCSSGSNAGTPNANGTVSSAGGDAPGSACAQYLQCVAAATPDALPVALQAYGPSGTCWGGSASLASECESACAASMAEVPNAGSFKASCPQSGTSALGTGSSTAPSGGSDGGASFGTGSGTGAGNVTDICSKARAEENCATQLGNCEVNSACTQTFMCIGHCSDPNNETCDDSCLPAGISTGDRAVANDLLICLRNSCGAACDPL